MRRYGNVLTAVFFFTILLSFSGCGIDSTPYISPPSAYASNLFRYSFKHSAAVAASENLIGYEVLYRCYARAEDAQADSTLIESYITTVPTNVYTNMLSMGYKRITPEDFSQDLLIIRNEHANLIGNDAEISFNFTAWDSVKMSIDDGTTTQESYVYRGVIGTTPNQGKGFDDIKLTDADVQSGTSPVTSVFLQAYVFSVGFDGANLIYFYSIPSKLGSDASPEIVS